MTVSRTGSIVGLGAVFIAILLFVTLRSTSTPLTSTPEDRSSARDACQRAVRTRVSDARFPHDANVQARDAGRLHLSGSVDGGNGGQAVRRNYECVLHRDGAGAFVADSVRVWQSH